MRLESQLFEVPFANANLQKEKADPKVGFPNSVEALKDQDL
jgi:hypothetical protein